MKVALAWRTLTSAKWRTLLGIGGIAFAIMLVFMQLGFYAAVSSSATQITDALEFDLMLRSPDYVFLPQARTIPRQRLLQAASSDGVERVVAFYVGPAMLANPELANRQEVLLFAGRPEEVATIIRDPEIRSEPSRWNRPDVAFIDRATRASYGPQEIGRKVELNRRQIEIVGRYSIGVGFVALGGLFMSDQNFVRVVPGRSLEDVSLGLVQLRPEAARYPERVAAQLASRLPRDVQVLTRAEVEDFERDYWLNRSSTGIVFGSGVVIALLVGTVILYQTLSSQVMRLLRELATLKAIGYDDRYLARFVLEQAALLTVLGFLPGLGMALWLYRQVAESAHLLIFMTQQRVFAVFALVLVMAGLSGLLALRKVIDADPADLF